MKEFEWDIEDDRCHDFQIVNCDTDSISFCKPDGKKFTDEENEALLAELNSLFPELIDYEDDGYFKKVLVIKAKNYILDDGKKLTVKGSALKAPNKEPALKEFINNVIEHFLKNKIDHLFMLYNKYACEIMNINNMDRWSFKKSITKAVLDSYEKEDGRKQERNVFDAIKSIDVQEGDKVKLYFDTPDSLKLVDNFDGVYDKNILMGKL